MRIALSTKSATRFISSRLAPLAAWTARPLRNGPQPLNTSGRSTAGINARSGGSAVRGREVIERRIEGIRQAVPAILDRAVIEAKSAVVKVIAQLIRILVQGIAELDRKIDEGAAAHPDFFIF